MNLTSYFHLVFDLRVGVLKKEAKSLEIIVDNRINFKIGINCIANK